jgi:hypothetical protein
MTGKRGRPTNREKRYRNQGRKTVFTPENLQKMETVIQMGGSFLLAYTSVGISESIFYEYLQKNPEYRRKLEEYKQRPILKAMKTVYNNLDIIDTAKWYLERKLKNEFSLKQEIENSGELNININKKIVETKDNEL